MYDARQTSVAAIVIHLSRKNVIGIQLPVSIQLSMPGVHPAVRAPLASGQRDVLQGERIVIVSMEELADGRKQESTPILAQKGGKIKAKRGVDETERAKSKRRPTPQPLPVREGSRYSLNLPFFQVFQLVRHFTPLPTREGLGGGSLEGLGGGSTIGIQAQRGCCRLVACGLEDIVVVANDERHRRQVVEAIAREVDFTRLTVGECNAIVDDSRVASADATHRHRLHSSCSAIVTHAQTCHVLQRIRHRVHSHSRHGIAVDVLYGNRCPHGISMPHGYHIHTL